MDYAWLRDSILPRRIPEEQSWIHFQMAVRFTMNTNLWRGDDAMREEFEYMYGAPYPVEETYEDRSHDVVGFLFDIGWRAYVDGCYIKFRKYPTTVNRFIGEYMSNIDYACHQNCAGCA